MLPWCRSYAYVPCLPERLEGHVLSCACPAALDAGFAKVEKRVRTAGGGATMTVRNLRIREDTAKYLLNLDVNSGDCLPYLGRFPLFSSIL